MSAQKNQPNSNIRDEKIAESYGSDYLKWKSWGNGADFGNLKKQEEAYFSAELKKSLRMFPPYSKVLEIGFGDGSFLQYSAKRQWKIFGVELNEHLVESALHSGFDVIHSDNLKDYDDDFFDLVVAFDVMEHIPQDSLTEFITEVKRILKVGGVFITRCKFGFPRPEADDDDVRPG